MKKDVYTISLYHNITISSFFCCFFNVLTIVMVMVMFMATFWSILIMGHHWCGEWRWETEATCVRLLRGCSPLLLSSICGATHILLASFFSLFDFCFFPFVFWILSVCSNSVQISCLNFQGLQGSSVSYLVESNHHHSTKFSFSSLRLL